MRNFFRTIRRSFSGLFVRLNLGYFFRSNKKIILRSLLGALGVIVVFVTVAALIPSHKYKDVVTVGDLSITNTEVIEYESDFESYINNGGIGGLSEGESDRRDNYEMAFDDNFRSIVLQDKAKECGITLDDSLNNINLNYDEYQFTLMRERNDNWERVLQDCVLNTKNLLYSAINYDTHPVFLKGDVSQEEAEDFYNSAEERLGELKLLFEQGKSAEEIIEASENSNIVNPEQAPIYTGLHRCLTVKDCFNRDPDLIDNQPYLDGIINANDIYHTKLINEGDWEGIIVADNGMFVIYRVESLDGEYDNWANFYQDMKDQYAYDEIPTAIFGTIKNLASGFLSFIDNIVYACNAIVPNFIVKDEHGVDVTSIVSNPNYQWPGAWCGSAVYIENFVNGYSGGYNRYQICPGDTDGTTEGHDNSWGRDPISLGATGFPLCTKGPINCVSDNTFGGVFIDPASGYELYTGDGGEGCIVNPNGYLTRNDGSGTEIGSNTPCSQLNATSNSYNFKLMNGNANKWTNTQIEFIVTIKSIKFTPTASSAMHSDNEASTTSGLQYYSTNSIKDTITVGVADGRDWTSGESAAFQVALYGPYQQPQTPQSPITPQATGNYTGSIPTGGEGVRNKEFTMYGPGTYEVEWTDVTSPGYYYAVVYCISGTSKVDNCTNTQKTAFGDPNETAVQQFQPFVTSSATEIWVDDANNSTISDTLTAHAAKSLQEANNGYQSGTDLARYWLKDSSGNFEKATFCVVAFGPYQTAQSGNDYSSSPTATTYSVPTDPNNIARQYNPTQQCQEFSGPETSQTYTWATNTWQPGYYYFMSYFRKANPTGTTSPTGLQGNNGNKAFIGDWTSHFNPNAEREVVVDKFQIKAASKTRAANTDNTLTPPTINTDIPADTASNSSAGHNRTEPDGIVDGNDSGSEVPVLKPTDNYIEDSIYIRAYDTNSSTDISDNERFWLKDLNGKYISFYVCANIYGPYQQPQGAGANGSSARLPAANQIGQVSAPNIPNNYNGNSSSRQQCFWTDNTGNPSTTNGLASSPTGGGPGEYKVRWSNTGDNYFYPGYYYIVWSVKKDSSTNNDDDSGSSGGNNCVTTPGNQNTHCTTVDLGYGRVTQENGDFLVSDWYSPFGEQSESFYVQFQPIARSDIPEFTSTNESDISGTGCSIYYKDGKQYCYRETGCYISNGEQICLSSTPPTCSDTTTDNCIIQSSSNPSSDNISQRKKSSANSGNGGIILECDENKYSNLVNYVDDPEKYPQEKLHCHNVVDQIWLGAVSDKEINDETHEVSSTDNDDHYWPKDKDGKFEPVKFQVKLYGPFSYPYSRTPSDENKAGWAGNNLVTVVPKDTDGESVEVPSAYAQPIAQSCVITTANVGPNWNENIVPYDAVFTQDISSCQGGTPSDTTIMLTPGFYVSVVEIVRDDIPSTNPEFVLSECDPATVSLSNRAANTKCSTQVNTRPHNMLIKDRFTSAWGDKRETLLVPIPLYIVTRRDNSAQDTFIDQVTINDQYWVAGFSGQYVDENGNKQPWTDIWGDPIPEYGTYNGQEGYVATSVPPGAYKYEYQTSGVEDYYLADTSGDIYVRLYGAYPLEWGRPNESDEYCVANKLVRNGTWRLPAEDTGPNGKDLPYPAPLTLYEKGWYVFQYSYSGGDRITDIKTQCGDTSEMFRIVKNEIGLVTAAYSDSPTAPTRITDTVQVTGSFEESDKDSIVKLSLYKRAGLVNDPGLGNVDGAPLCTVIFTVDAAGTYTTADYIDENGYVLADVQGSGRCYASDGGHYYWIEEFLRPGSNPLNPTDSDYLQPIGKGESPENIDILPPPTPEVVTDADPTTSVNKPFRDAALVTNIPEGNTKKYYLWFTAYGPFADGQVNCSNQLIYSNQSSPITVTQNGTYYSDYITVSSNGIVYWVEHLQDEDGNIVDQGECGTRRENTYVTGTDTTVNTFEPFQVTPLYPDSGYISQQLGKVIMLGFISMLGAWQLTNKNSWLLRKR